MHQLNDIHPQDQSTLQLRVEMREWVFGLRCLFAAFALLPLYYCSRILMAGPAVERVFEDMLGSKDRLPVVSRFMFKWSEPMLDLLWALTALVMLLIFRARRARTVWTTTVALVIFLIVISHLAITSFVEPLGQVIQNLSGGSGETPL